MYGAASSMSRRAALSFSSSLRVCVQAMKYASPNGVVYSVVSGLMMIVSASR